jgi:hypothetical protein
VHVNRSLAKLSSWPRTWWRIRRSPSICFVRRSVPKMSPSKTQGPR